MGNYDDIINLPHHVSTKHPQMSMLARAAQFAPFAALTGHGAAIEETARITDSQVELDEDARSFLDRKLALLLNHIGDETSVTFTYFTPDQRKQGGAYCTTTAAVKKWDELAQTFLLTDGSSIHLSSILDLSGPLFEDLSE